MSLSQVQAQKLLRILQPKIDEARDLAEILNVIGPVANGQPAKAPPEAPPSASPDA